MSEIVEATKIYLSAVGIGAILLIALYKLCNWIDEELKPPKGKGIHE